MQAAIEAHPEQQPVDDPRPQDAQRARLRQLHDELVAEGADGTAYLRELELRAATWPERPAVTVLDSGAVAL